MTSLPPGGAGMLGKVGIDLLWYMRATRVLAMGVVFFLNTSVAAFKVPKRRILTSQTQFIRLRVK